MKLMDGDTTTSILANLETRSYYCIRLRRGEGIANECMTALGLSHLLIVSSYYQNNTNPHRAFI